MDRGRLVFHHPTGSVYSIVEESVKIEGKQVGLACSFVQTQHFVNQFDVTVGLKYSYQTDLKFCVYKLQFFIDDVEIMTVIREKSESKEIYSEAKSRGHSAIISKTGKRGLNLIELGNLPPRSNVRVITYFVFNLNLFELDRITMKLPIEKYQGINFQFELDIDVQFEIDHVNANECNQNDIRHIQIDNLQNSNPQLKNIIIEEYLKKPIHSHIIKNGEYSCINFIPPEIENVRKNVELIFIVDCSYSMTGDRIKNASECLEIFLKSMPFGCIFNIYRFGSNYEKLFHISQEYNQMNMEIALKYAKEIKADLCNTYLQKPLEDIYNKKSKESVVFILTDGDTQEMQLTMEMVKKNEDTKIFSIGLGNDCDNGLLEFMAKRTNGICSKNLTTDKLMETVIGMLKNALYNIITSYSIECEGCNSPIIYPYPLPCLYTNVLQTFYIKGSDINSILFSFDGKDVIVSDTYEYNDESIEVMFNKSIIENLEKQIDKDPTNQELINTLTAASIKSGILCSRTAYIGVDESKAVKKDDSAQTKEECLNLTQSQNQESCPTQINGSLTSEPIRPAQESNHDNQNVSMQSFPPPPPPPLPADYLLPSNVIKIYANKYEIGITNQDIGMLSQQDGVVSSSSDDYSDESSSECYCGESYYYSDHFSLPPPPIRQQSGLVDNDSSSSDGNSESSSECYCGDSDDFSPPRPMWQHSEQVKILATPLYDCYDSSSNISHKTSGKDKYLELVRLQSFEGFWQNIGSVLKIYDINKQITLAEISDERIICTLLALALIQLMHGELMQASFLIENKARSWIKSQDSSLDIDHLIASIKSQLQND